MDTTQVGQRVYSASANSYIIIYYIRYNQYIYILWYIMYIMYYHHVYMSINIPTHINTFHYYVLLCAHHAIKCHLFDPIGTAFSHWYYISSPSTPQWPMAQPPILELAKIMILPVAQIAQASELLVEASSWSDEQIQLYAVWFGFLVLSFSQVFITIYSHDLGRRRHCYNSILPISRKCAITPKPLNFIPIRCPYSGWMACMECGARFGLALHNESPKKMPKSEL